VLQLSTQIVEGYATQPAATALASGYRNHLECHSQPCFDTLPLNSQLTLELGQVSQGIPQGIGYHRTTLSTAGILTWSGMLGDGTATSFSSPLGPDGRYIFYIPLTQAKEHSWHWGIAPNGSTSAITGNATWMKHGPSNNKDRTYTAGFGKTSPLLHSPADPTKPQQQASVSSGSTTPSHTLSSNLVVQCSRRTPMSAWSSQEPILSPFQRLAPFPTQTVLLEP